MIQYLLEVTLCWAIFYIIFFALLRKITFYRVNRWYLLTALLLGIIIPLLRNIEVDVYQRDIAEIVPLVYVIKDAPAQIAVTVIEQTTNWNGVISHLLWGIYLIGLSLFAFRFGKGLNTIRQLFNSGIRTKLSSHTLIETNKNHLPFSFLNSIFISSTLDLKEDINDILQHELAHVESRHSIDVLILEMINIIFWFHPLVYLYKTALRQTHEYLADAVVLENTPRKLYGQILLKQSLSGIQVALAHSFFHSHIKKRINMMYQKKSGQSAWLKYSLALPVLFILFIVFSGYDQKAYTTEDLKQDLSHMIYQGSNETDERLGDQKVILDIIKNYNPKNHFAIAIDNKIIENNIQNHITPGIPFRFNIGSIRMPDIALKTYGSIARHGVLELFGITQNIPLSNIKNATKIIEKKPLVLDKNNNPILDFIRMKNTYKSESEPIYRIYKDSYKNYPSKFNDSEVAFTAIFTNQEFIKKFNTNHTLLQMPIAEAEVVFPNIQKIYENPTSPSSPLIYLDNTLLKDQLSNHINLENDEFETFDWIPSDVATKIYGPDAKNGVIVITSTKNIIQTEYSSSVLDKKPLDIKEAKSKKVQEIYTRSSVINNIYFNGELFNELAVMNLKYQLPANGSYGTVDLYQEFKILHPEDIRDRKEFHYYITNYDNKSISNLEITKRGILSYKSLQDAKDTEVQVFLAVKKRTLDDTESNESSENPRYAKIKSDQSLLRLFNGKFIPMTLKEQFKKSTEYNGLEMYEGKKEIESFKKAGPRPNHNVTKEFISYFDDNNYSRVFNNFHSKFLHEVVCNVYNIQIEQIKDDQLLLHYKSEKAETVDLIVSPIVGTQNVVQSIKKKRGEQIIFQLDSHQIPTTGFVISVYPKWFKGGMDSPVFRIQNGLLVSDQVAVDQWKNKLLTLEGKSIKTSYLKDTLPLIVIDGIVQSEDFDLNSLNPEDIKNMTVRGKSEFDEYWDYNNNKIIEIVTKNFELKKLKEKKSKGESKESKTKNIFQTKGEVKKPLFVIDDEIVKHSKVENLDLDPDEIVTINVIKGQAAIDQYGDNGIDGVVVIRTKNPKRNTIKESSISDITFKKSGESNSIEIKDEEGIVVTGKANKIKIYYDLVDQFNDQVDNRPLFVVDGEVIKLSSGENLDIEPNSIESIKVLKGQAAIDEYGSRGSDGVVIILSKGFQENRKKMNIKIIHDTSFDPNSNSFEIYSTETQAIAELDTIVTFDPDTFEETWKVEDSRNELSITGRVQDQNLVTIEFESKITGDVKLSLFNLNGQLIDQRTVQHLNTNDPSIHSFQLQNRSTEIIIATAEQEGKAISTKIVFVK